MVYLLLHILSLPVTVMMWILVEVFHVYDGDNALKEKRYRTVSVPKNASFQSILVSSCDRRIVFMFMLDMLT